MSTSTPANPPAFTSLRVERTGGIAGLKLSAQHDFAALSKAQQQAVSRVAHQPAAGGPVGATRAPQPGADRFTYRLHLTDADGNERTVELPEDAMPDTLKPLVQPP